MKNFFYDVAVNRPLPQLFTYESSKAIQIGSRVKILFGKKELLGIVLRKSSQPEFQTNLILDVLDDKALFSRHQLELLQWAADYYKHPKGEAVHNFIPPYLKKLGNTFPKTITESVHCSITKSNLSLTKEQKTAIANIQKITRFNTHVLQGVTGSGKTEVYLKAIESILNKKQSVLVLVPEISLVPQTLGRFKDRFGDICHAYHSGMTPKARMKVWEEAAIEAPKIIIGTRSSILLPLKNRGLFIEEVGSL